MESTHSEEETPRYFAWQRRFTDEESWADSSHGEVPPTDEGMTQDVLLFVKTAEQRRSVCELLLMFSCLRNKIIGSFYNGYLSCARIVTFIYNSNFKSNINKQHQ